MTKAVIADLDGVIRFWNDSKTRGIENVCKLKRGTLARMVFEPSLLTAVVMGKITHEQWEQRAKESIQALYGVAIAENYIKAWQESDYQIDHDFIRLLRALFPKSQILLATNATTRLAQDLKKADLQLSFDAVFNSSAMGVAKPRKEFFQGMLMSMGLKPADVIFVDDTERNVTAAQALGIDSILYQSRSITIDQLSRRSNRAAMAAS